MIKRLEVTEELSRVDGLGRSQSIQGGKDFG